MNVHTFPFHIGDFLGGTMHMDATEIGAYVMLIVAHYQAGEEGLPDDSAKLARMAKVTPKVWSRIKDVVLDKFTKRNSNWVSQRVVDELQKMARKSSQNSDKSLKRWNGDNATALPQQSNSNAIHNPISNIQDSSKELSKTRVRANGEFDAWYSRYPHKIGRKAAEKAFEGAIQKTDLQTLLAGVERYIATKPTDRPWCNPATWLNQERWLDQPSENQNRGEKNGHNAPSKQQRAERALDEAMRRIAGQSGAGEGSGGTELRDLQHLRQGAGDTGAFAAGLLGGPAGSQRGGYSNSVQSVAEAEIIHADTGGYSPDDAAEEMGVGGAGAADGWRSHCDV